MKNEIDLFLDSGAFSAWSKGVEIDIDEYISFIKKYEKYINVYSVLDHIGNPELTLENQKIMEKAGLSPLPCFHYGSDIKYLEHYLANYDYMALGGMVPVSTNDLYKWLDDLYGNFICDSSGMPKVKIHGFGLTSLRLMVRYPWYSVDSTSWVMASRMGSVYVPRQRGGKWSYGEESWKVVVSTRSPSKEIHDKHFDTLSLSAQEVITEYFSSKGYKLGKSDMRQVDEDYELKERERWWGKEEADAQRALNMAPTIGWSEDKIVETVIELGLCNDYKMRDELNIIYFLDLEKQLPSWPWPYKRKGAKRFQL